MTKIQLKPYLTVRRKGGSLRIGTVPPRGIEIEKAPPELDRLVELLSSPASAREVATRMAGVAEVDEAGWAEVIEQLCDAGVVGPVVPSESRYARHLLYFDLIGLDAEQAQQRLRTAKVAVVGTGGIGSNVATLLAAAGVGELVLTDGDVIEVSNLTRQFLYGESTVGSYKVDAAVTRLAELNSEVKVTALRTAATEELFREQLRDCDVVVVSADSPDELHQWIDDGARDNGYAYLAAGYIEAYGSVGPVVIPGLTACYACLIAQGEEVTDDSVEDGQSRNLNLGHQAASYGPLNLTVAAIAANEVIRLLTGAPSSVAGRRVLVDSQGYSLTTEDFERISGCPACGGIEPRASWRDAVETITLEDVYRDTRTDASINAVVLDDFLLDLALEDQVTTALDYGCGTGEQALALARRGVQVLAFDPSAQMVEVLGSRLADESGLAVQTSTDAAALVGSAQVDLVMCSNVLDHVHPDDLDEVLAFLRVHTASSGRAIITVPHPVKDGATWIRAGRDDGWDYREIRLREYFEEGVVSKHRETATGDVAMRSIKTYHRTIESYAGAFLRHGFTIVGLHEPQPQEWAAEEFPEIWAKTTRIPYFLTFVLRPSDAWHQAPAIHRARERG